MPKPDETEAVPKAWDEPTKRGEILRAAAKLFFEKGYEATTTREIATLAKTSKRTVYAEFPTKQVILQALIAGGAAEMTEAIDLELPATRAELFATLRRFGDRFLRLALDERRMSMTRLAIAESRRSPEIAHAIESLGRQKLIGSVERVLRHAAGAGLIDGRDVELVMNGYFYVLLANLQMGMLLGTQPPPTPEALAKRVDLAMAIVERVAVAPGGKGAGER